MKTVKTVKTILVALAVIISTASLQSCSSDDDSSGSNSDTFIRFTIDGTDYDFRDIITAESGVITLNGNNGTGGFGDSGDTDVSLWLPLSIENGTFNVENSFTADYQVSFTSVPLAFDFDFASNGSITLTQTTGEFIEGTFTATVTNDDNTTITLENGSFRAFSIE